MNITKIEESPHFPIEEANRRRIPIVMNSYELKMLNDLALRDNASRGHVDQIKEILTKPLQERTNTESRVLGNLIKNIPFFKDK